MRNFMGMFLWGVYVFYNVFRGGRRLLSAQAFKKGRQTKVGNALKV